MNENILKALYNDNKSYNAYLDESSLSLIKYWFTKTLCRVLIKIMLEPS